MPAKQLSCAICGEPEMGHMHVKVPVKLYGPLFCEATEQKIVKWMLCRSCGRYMEYVAKEVRLIGEQRSSRE